MLREILIGIYINLSLFLASYFLISSLVLSSQSKTLKIILTYLLSTSNIIFILFLLNFVSDGITTVNIFIASQLFLIFSFALHLLRKGPLSFFRQIPTIKFPQNKTVLILAIILSVDILVNLYSLYLYPPVEPDTLAYHLQGPPNWYQAKNLSFFPSNEQRTMILSDNLSFLTLWLFLSFQSDAMIEIAPYSMLIFGSLAIFYFLQTLNKNPGRNFIFSLLYYFGGSYLSYFSKSFTNDVGLAAFTLSSLSLLYAYFRQRSSVFFFFFSLSNGLLLGTKSLAPLSILLIYLLAFFAEISVKRKEGWKKTITKYLSSIIICLAVGGFFYFRNSYFFHNPLYGKEINFFNLVHLPGGNLLAYEPFGLNLAKVIPLSFDLLKKLLSGALGYQTTFFYLPAVIALLLFYRKNINKITLLIILYPMIYAFCFLSLFGDNSLRYFFSLNLTGIVSLAIVIQLIKNKNIKKLGYIMIVIFILFASTQKIFSNMIIKSLFNHNFPLKPEVIPYYDGDYYFFFRNIPQGITLVYLLPENAFIYPFYGSKYENRLIYTNSADDNEIIQLFRKSGAEYFLGKKPEGDLSNSFLRTDLGKHSIENIPETKIYAMTEELVKKGILTQIGSGTRINFYKINNPTDVKN